MFLCLSYCQRQGQENIVVFVAIMMTIANMMAINLTMQFGH